MKNSSQQGRPFWNHDLAKEDMPDDLSDAYAGYAALTKREYATLAHIVRGASNKETARLLGVSPRTIEFHRANIMKKFEARNIADLIRKVLRG